MRLLIVTTPLFPAADANSHCVQNLLAGFGGQGHTVDVLACSPVRRNPASWNGHRVYSVFCPSLVPLGQARQLYRRRPILLLQTASHKLVNHLQMKLSPHYRREEIIVEAYRKLSAALRCILRKERYDGIIATLFPLDAVLAVAENHGDVPWYIYQMDVYAGNKFLSAGFHDDRERLQTRLFAHADGIFTTPVLLSTAAMQPYKLTGKAVSVEFPCIAAKTAWKPYKGWQTAHAIRCAYVGTLYADIRSPEYLVSLIARLPNGEAVFYFFGLRQTLVCEARDYARAAARIDCRGNVDMEDALGVLYEADILVNIDNKVSNQVPSKIFDYMSTGKPIINLYYHENSPTLDYFRQYPMILNLPMDEARLEQNAADMAAFIQRFHGQQVGFDAVRKELYRCTPDYVAGQMLARIKGAVGGQALDAKAEGEAAE